MTSVLNRHFTRVRRTTLRGLINWIASERASLHQHYVYQDGRVRDVDIIKELALFDKWLKELRRAQKRLTT